MRAINRNSGEETRSSVVSRHPFPAGGFETRPICLSTFCPRVTELESCLRDLQHVLRKVFIPPEPHHFASSTRAQHFSRPRLGG